MRASAQARAPFAAIQSSWPSISSRVAIAGVLSVWFRRELSRAFLRLRNSGIQRPDAAIRSIRSTAAGETRANHSPPSLAKFFCGAK
ncbi:hypothetical protein GCM10025881_27360 [Pseudolysinimonas kribbensis]|uniref:Uncharacterized protein n=1 Tax=Pseudolysinimonas kribbensis TaxID=433641 RepID=A0ABQ6KAZ8_9MICO|nr:hypothetical protein GCM10025881_27360 [Pseudolysinimonas kribbensis]